MINLINQHIINVGMTDVYFGEKKKLQEDLFIFDKNTLTNMCFFFGFIYIFVLIF